MIVPGLRADAPICAPEDIQGACFVQPQGFFTAGPAQGPFAATGILVFDSSGNFSGVTSSSFNGQIFFPFPITGDYSFTADCQLTTHEHTLGMDSWPSPAPLPAQAS